MKIEEILNKLILDCRNIEDDTNIEGINFTIAQSKQSILSAIIKGLPEISYHDLKPIITNYYPTFEGELGALNKETMAIKIADYVNNYIKEYLKGLGGRENAD